LTKVIERHGDLRERYAGMVSQARLAHRSIHLEQHDEDSVEIGRGNRRWHAPGDGLPIPQGSKGTLRQGMTLRGPDRRGCPESVALPHQLLTALDAIVECGSDALTVEDVQPELVGEVEPTRWAEVPAPNNVHAKLGELVVAPAGIACCGGMVGAIGTEDTSLCVAQHGLSSFETRYSIRPSDSNGHHSRSSSWAARAR